MQKAIECQNMMHFRLYLELSVVLQFFYYFLDLNGLEQHVRGGEEMGCYFH